MHFEITQLIDKYGITRTKIAECAEVSLPTVSLVLSGKRSDRRGIINTALDLVEAAKAEEEEMKRRLSALTESAAA